MHRKVPYRSNTCWLLSVIFVACSSLVSVLTASAAIHLQTLTQANQVRHLTPEQAALGYPVRIRGIITEDVPSPDFVIQDASGGIYVIGSHNPSFQHHFGDLVEVEGVTQAGGFAPTIHEEHSRILGKGSLPKSRFYSLSELTGGQLDSQWVKIQGVVHSAFVDRISWHEAALDMNLFAGGGQFEVRVPIFSAQVDASSWIGAEVSIQGVCGSLFNASHQLVGLVFYVPRLSFIKVIDKTRELPVAALLRFSPDRPVQDRVRLQGVVTYQQRGKAVYLQSEGKGLRVLTQQDISLASGDVVEVLGFPAVGESEPVLEGAVLQRIGHQTSPSPMNFVLMPPIERYDGALVTINGTLLQRRQEPDGLDLLLEIQGLAFDAIVPPGKSSERLLRIPLKSEVRIIGICLVRNGGVWHNPASFRILVRAPEDVSVTKMPSWLNFRRSLWLLGIMVGTLLVVFAWVVMLRGRLHEQMALYRKKLQSSAILEERNRIARELHDTLEQDLAGITMQLDLAVDCFERATPVARHAVESARNMSRHSMMEARRSVWDLRCHLLENGNLVYALGQVVELLGRRSDIKIDVNVVGEPTQLASSQELNLLRIGQEAMTNAVKHAQARNINLELHYAPEKVRLSVTDDGTGFVSGEAASGGHFGLFDMHERAEALGSHLEVASKAGIGTRIGLEIAVKP